MLHELTVGWRQLRSVRLTANSPAVPIEIPTLDTYRKYCLAVPAAVGVYLVPESLTLSTLVTGSSPKVFGIWETSVRFWAAAAVPTPLVVTPFVSESGEAVDLPVVYPASSAVISGTMKLAQFVATPSQTVFILPIAPASPADVTMKVNGKDSVNGLEFSVVGNVATWLNTYYTLNGDAVQFFYQV